MAGPSGGRARHCGDGRGGRDPGRSVRRGTAAYLLSCLVRCRTLAASGDWRAPQPQEVAEILDDAARRFARTDEELRDVLIEVLDEMAEDLVGHGDLLWDRVPERFLPEGPDQRDHWLPKNEYALQAYTAHELDLRLVRRGIIVNREVLVRVTDVVAGSGERTDVQVEAATRLETASGPTADRVAVVVEIKGCWNREVPTAQRKQLAERYLPAARSRAGIYLVGLFPQRWWTPTDYRRQDAARYAPDSLPKDLAEQADDIAAELGVSTVPFVLTVSLALLEPRRQR